MRNGVGLEPTRLVEGLGATTDRHKFLDPVAGAPSFAAKAAAIRTAMSGSDAIQSARAVAEDFRTGDGFEGAVVGLVAVHSERQAVLETLTARLLAVLPDLHNHGLLRRAITGLRSSPLGLFALADLPIEGFEGLFAIPTQGVADLVDHCTSPCLVATSITLPAALLPFFFARMTHDPRS